MACQPSDIEVQETSYVPEGDALMTPHLSDAPTGDHALSVSSTFRLDGRVSVITGGAGGIGRAIACRFAEAGAVVVLSDLRRDAAETTASHLRDAGYQAASASTDVTVREDVEALVANTIKEFGQIDIFINNAGIMGPTAPLWEVSDESWDQVMSVDLRSVFLCCRAVAARMRARGRGAIVNVASIAGKEGTPMLGPYSVAKAGIIALTKALGKELIRDGVRVNCVAPAVIDTPLLEQLPSEAVQTMLNKAPMGRLGAADEVAAVVHFLASDAASFVTAQCYDASGGRATY
jgi:2-dehydro-3-deoxy-L-rhamnonate dehydrogenase (NAD+)